MLPEECDGVTRIAHVSMKLDEVECDFERGHCWGALCFFLLFFFFFCGGWGWGMHIFVLRVHRKTKALDGGVVTDLS